MNILLTGPTGFIGSSFIRLALRNGHRIAGLLIPAESIPAGLPASPQLVWLSGTLEEAPWQEIDAFRPDACIHTAWITTPGIYLESPENERFRDASLAFLRRSRRAGARHIISFGTCVEYAMTNQPLSEEKTPVHPTSLYARCKNDLHLALQADAATDPFQLCWTRIFYPYGPGEHPSRLCSSIIQKLARNESITLQTPDSTKDYIFIEDLAAAIMTVVEKQFTGTINLGTGIGVSVRQIAQTLAAIMEKPGLILEKSPPEVDPLGFIVADASRLRGLGWRPAHNLEDGLKKLFEAAR